MLHLGVSSDEGGRLCAILSSNEPKNSINQKLRQWYLSMITKASKEDIVVNHTNMHDQFFVASKSCNFKVTATRLPYFDGDYWSGAAIDEMMRLQEKYEGDYDKMLEQLVTKRALKSMGHTKASKDTIKDFLVMRKAVVDDIPCDTKENDIILHNDLFKSRVDILTFCQQNHLQFDTLRHAKYTTMKLMYHLKSSALMHNGDPRCSICYKDHNGSQLSWNTTNPEDLLPFDPEIERTILLARRVVRLSHKINTKPDTQLESDFAIPIVSIPVDLSIVLPIVFR
ncbi:hypothetical protein K1719_017956 [Acacia pycnantha]|nr:hypothetical protein K1719_017956 [Acacia pycnantha]